MKRRIALFLLFAVLIGTVIACKSSSDKEFTPVKLQDDYYEHINGMKLASVQIPADSGVWLYANDIGIKIENDISAIVDDIIAKKNTYPENTPELKIANLYQTALDLDARQNAGFGELQQYIDSINSATNIQEYIQRIGEIGSSIGFFSLFPVGSNADLTNPEQYIWTITGMNLGAGKEMLENPNQVAAIKEYEKYYTKFLMFTGKTQTEATAAAAEIIKFQKAMASVSLPLNEKSNPSIVYNPKTKAELASLLSNIDIEMFMSAFLPGGTNLINVEEIKQIKKINEYLKDSNVELLKNYSLCILIYQMADYLSPEIRNAKMELRKYLSGAQTVKSDKRLAMEILENALGFEIGKLYVEKHFPAESKADIKQMIENIIKVYYTKIDNLDWMSKETKAKAKKKLEKMTIQIGYPDVWPTVQSNTVIKAPKDNGILINNILNINKAEMAYRRSIFDKPVDKAAWYMVPQTVNAYYTPGSNSMVFPAGILQAPYYDINAGEAVNLGGIGFVIAHEITHAFDDSGSQYDETGKYSNWWTEADKAHFTSRANAIVEYYNGIEVLPGRYINGKQTLGENIADLGAASCIAEIMKNDKEKLKQLFQNYAKIWAAKMTEKALLERLDNDVHSLSKVRVNAVLSTTDAFYEAYPEITPTDKMYLAPEKRIKLW